MVSRTTLKSLIDAGVKQFEIEEVSAMLHRYIKLTIDPATAQGWAKNDDGQRMFFTKDGVMVAGQWLQIASKWYYFYADGSLAKDTVVNGYEVDENGARKIK